MEMLFFLLMLVATLALITMKFFAITGSFVILKALASALFVITGIVSYKTKKENKKYFIWILLGLIFSFCGDVFLELNNTPKFLTLDLTHIKGVLFINGVGSFALAHIMYFIGFSTLRKVTLVDIVITIAIASPMIFLELFGDFQFNGLQLVVIGYTILISLMVSKAISLYKYYLRNKKAVIMTITGAMMFLVSDIILLFLLFSKGDFIEPDNLKYLEYSNLIIYYVGQGILALSLGQKFSVRKKVNETRRLSNLVK
ncbi:lysoplasmalogenase family protein [Clostridium cellulovorans]|uniref:YhhN family protein n=1 Tax=Clostridium cellulovorans (strain ATCC 35296 / DSM 3052 / OCM 3 / 743B) TaxID=573061 RepID=D9SUF4_CLOC7|nr:lysoplasmalogenase family protein [Clostridium cellulovorans]ADL52909.1 YhhN family protein [Clostridium cellulovorans 743B]